MSKTTDKTPKTVYMTDEMIEQLEQAAEEHDTPFTEIAERAIMHTLHRTSEKDWYAHMRRHQIERQIKALEKEREPLPENITPALWEQFQDSGFPEEF